MGLFGRATTIPTLWLYAENDRHFPPPFANEMFGAFRAGSPGAELVRLGSLGANGHMVFLRPQAMPLWTGRWPGSLPASGCREVPVAASAARPP